MRDNTLFYAEIADKITDHLCKNPDHLLQIDRSIRQSDDPSETIWTIVSEAAYIFESIESLAAREDVNWIGAVQNYSDEVLDHLLVGQMPNSLDMVAMASRSMQTTM